MNIDLKLGNILDRPMHYEIGVTCLFIDTRYKCNSAVITQQSFNPPISKFSRRCNKFKSQCSQAINDFNASK